MFYEYSKFINIAELHTLTYDIDYIEIFIYYKSIIDAYFKAI
ncbi:protein of unknown function [Thermococcus nautili]|nr:protein of unknown function [Thermococcus nautili]